MRVNISLVTPHLSPSGKSVLPNVEILLQERLHEMLSTRNLLSCSLSKQTIGRLALCTLLRNCQPYQHVSSYAVCITTCITTNFPTGKIYKLIRLRQESLGGLKAYIMYLKLALGGRLSSASYTSIDTPRRYLVELDSVAGVGCQKKW